MLLKIHDRDIVDRFTPSTAAARRNERIYARESTMTSWEMITVKQVNVQTDRVVSV